MTSNSAHGGWTGRAYMNDIDMLIMESRTGAPHEWTPIGGAGGYSNWRRTDWREEPCLEVAVRRRPCSH